MSKFCCGPDMVWLVMPTSLRKKSVFMSSLSLGKRLKPLSILQMYDLFTFRKSRTGTWRNT